MDKCCSNSMFNPSARQQYSQEIFPLFPFLLLSTFIHKASPPVCLRVALVSKNASVELLMSESVLSRLHSFHSLPCDLFFFLPWWLKIRENSRYLKMGVILLQFTLHAYRCANFPRCFVGLEMHYQSLPQEEEWLFDLLIHIVVVSKRFSFVFVACFVSWDGLSVRALACLKLRGPFLPLSS